MASLWYDTVPCTGAENQEVSEISVTPQPTNRDVMITIRRDRGRPVRIRLAPGWARVFADLVHQSALQVQYKPPAAPTRSPSRRLRAA